MKHGLIYGKSGYPIDYVINGEQRDYNHGNSAFETIDLVDLGQENLFKTKPVHFGKVFKEDSRRVWNALKSLLIKSSAYDHVLEYDSSSNGRKGWITLKKFFEGQDFI